ncbi:MAG: tryptophan-rich sensory protein [Anaerolineae bacterium]|nr:tryptophan-rich sensory protein [Anaerolineae bacterium]
MNKDLIRQISVVVSLVVMVVVNALANALPINGITTAEISDSFQVFFVPAGYVFAIWGLIYLALFVYAIYQALPAQRENPRLRRTGWIFVLSSLANTVWIFCWHYGYFALSVAVMVVLLGSLIAIYWRLGTGRTAVNRAEQWAVRVPFSIYLGWITVATIANVTILLDFVSWSGWGIAPEVWTVIMLAVAVVVAGLMALRHRDIAYLLVLVWAFAGIGVKQAETPLVANAAWIATVLVALMVIVTAVQSRRKPRKLVVVAA